MILCPQQKWFYQRIYFLCYAEKHGVIKAIQCFAGFCMLTHECHSGMYKYSFWGYFTFNKTRVLRQGRSLTEARGALMKKTWDKLILNITRDCDSKRFEIILKEFNRFQKNLKGFRSITYFDSEILIEIN